MTDQPDRGPSVTGHASPRLHSGVPRRLHTLDAIRGIAAMIVLIHHCLLLQPAFSDYFFSNWQSQATSFGQALLFYTPLRLIWSGYEAVTLFFVLSGFVLALPWIERRQPDYGDFVIQRTCRIYLPYAAIIALAAIPAAILQPGFHIVGGSTWVNTECWSAPVTIRNLVQHALMVGQTEFRINGAVHSLVWEMRVSLLFPLLVLPLLRWGVWGAGAMLVLLLATTRVLQILVAREAGAPDLLGTTVTFAAWEIQRTAYFSIFFVIGAAIAFHIGGIRRLLGATQRYCGGPILMAIGLLLVQTHWSETRAYHNLGVAAGASLIIVAALAPGRIEGCLSHRWLQFLGRISYSIYLVQIPVLLLTAYALQTILPLWAMPFVVVPLVLALGWIFDLLVTERFARLGKRITRGLRERASLASAPVPAPAGSARQPLA